MTPKKNSFLEICGSLAFAIILIGGLGVILIISTSLESAYGTPFVQRFFYQAGWFDVWLALLAVNIVCSAALRWPFKKKHTGFIITHVGILLLLIGSLLSRLAGVEGQMMLMEGEAKETIVQPSYEIVVHSNGKTHSFDVTSKPDQKNITRVWDNAVESTDIKEGLAGAPTNPAIQLTLTSAMAGAHETFWLLDHLQVGPAFFELKNGVRATQWVAPTTPVVESQSPKLRIGKKEWENDFSIDLENHPDGDIPLGKTGLKISDLQYYPDARVNEKNKIVTASQEPLNPAVAFNVIDAAGQNERHVKFALFPEFNSLHGKESKNIFDLTVSLIATAALKDSKNHSPSLTFYTGQIPWSYESRSSKGQRSGNIEQGKTYPAGWMDFEFRVEKILKNAVVEKTVRRALENEKGQMAVEISGNWVMEDKPVKIASETGEMIFALRQKVAAVPFELTLKDFRKVDYPGTRSAASFESDVRLADAKEGIAIEKTISMNKPLDYKGFRIFQSSYIQDPEHGEASVFTIAKNPGIWLIYSGSVILFLGIFLTFFVTPFSSIKS